MADLYLTWQDIHSMSRKLALELSAIEDWKRMLVITRGGLVPAAILSQDLGINWIETIGLSSYRGQEQTSLELIKPCQIDSARYLVVDELVDSGDTARYVRALIPNCYIATLIAKPDGQPHADKFVQLVDQETWVYFPWEVNE